MNMTYADLFKELIADPLQRVVGKQLRAVVYSVLYHDAVLFDLDSPNTSGGCQIVRLRFADAEVGLDWDWKSVFRPEQDDEVSPPIVYHLTALSETVRPPVGDMEQDAGEHPLQSLDATSAAPWKAIQGEILERIIVWAIPLPAERYSPQAVELQFPSARIVVAIGMTSPLCLSDGDELLVLEAGEWEQQRSGLEQPCWSSPTKESQSCLY